MEKVITRDGSITYHNEKYDECYHSKSGALEEAEKKFAEPSNIKDGMIILDVCFGLGYNSLAAMKKAKRLKIIGLEQDREILKKIQEIEIDNCEYEKIKKASETGYYKDEDVEIEIIIGDAVDTIKKIKIMFDCVFLDPFSPKNNPELWTEGFLSELNKKMKKGGVLTTYSCARNVRENMQKAGFKVFDGPRVGRRGPSTIAYV